MGEIEKYQGTSGALTTTSGRMRLVEWALEADAAYKLAENLCKTPFGKAYAQDPFGAAAAILKGAEVGLTPVTSLGAFDLIQGQPAAKAITLRALVQSQGHEVWIETSTASECVAKAKRKGESQVHESKWTIKRATDLGLTNKDNWKKQPQAMLMARATSEVCRLVAADVILGIGYSSEELLDEVSSVVELKRDKKTSSPAVAIARKSATENASEVEEPEFDDEEADKKTDQPTESEDNPEDIEPISAAQIKTIGAAMTRLGMTDRAVAIAYVGDVVEHPITSRKDLTKDEASKVIRSLLADEDALKDSADKKYQEELAAEAKANGDE